MADETESLTGTVEQSKVLAWPLMLFLIPHRMPKARTGERYGRLVIQFTEYRTADGRGNRRACAVCKCDCGNSYDVLVKSLLSGKTRSCGCYQRDWTIAKHTTHGMNRHPLYTTWCQMRQRCKNPNDSSYHKYGGRGITVCLRWNSFRTFVSDMGERPTSQHSIDRINNNKGYSPKNCRWATKKEQAHNRRGLRWYSFCGERLIASEWAKRFGITLGTLIEAIDKHGWRVALKNADARHASNRRGKRLIHYRGSAVNTSKLIRRQVIAIKRRFVLDSNARRLASDLADQYCVSVTAICRIRDGLSWGWLEVPNGR